jgi:hypothetical protein
MLIVPMTMHDKDYNDDDAVIMLSMITLRGPTKTLLTFWTLSGSGCL